MNEIYDKYRHSDTVKLIRMMVLLSIGVLLLCIGLYKLYAHETLFSVRIFSAIVLVMGLLILAAVGFIEIFADISIAALYPFLAAAFGLIFIFLIPAYETPDEQVHFGSAYNVSNAIVGYGSPYKDGTFPDYDIKLFRYMRFEDATIAEADVAGEADVDTYDNVFAHLGRVSDEGDLKVVAINYCSDGGSLLYILPAIGITIARLTHLGFGWAYIFGVLLNMAFYISMTTYAIRKIPFGKRIIFTVSMLPITMQQMASFSYDCGLMACITVIVAISYSLRYEKSSEEPHYKWNIRIPYINMTVVETCLFVLCTILIASVKSGVFLVVILLPLALFIGKEWFTGKNKRITITAIVLIVSAIIIYMTLLDGFYKLQVFMYSAPHDIRHLPGTMGLAPIEYIKNPSRLWTMIVTTIRESLGYYIAQIGGASLGYLRISTPRIICIVNILMLLLAMVRYDTERDTYSIISRIVTFIIGFVPIAITALAMMLYWTLPTDAGLVGFQGRYVLPTLAILMLSIGRWRRFRLPNIDNVYAEVMTLTLYATCIGVLSFVS